MIDDAAVGTTTLMQLGIRHRDQIIICLDQEKVERYKQAQQQKQQQQQQKPNNTQEIDEEEDDEEEEEDDEEEFEEEEFEFNPPNNLEEQYDLELQIAIQNSLADNPKQENGAKKTPTDQGVASGGTGSQSLMEEEEEEFLRNQQGPRPKGKNVVKKQQ